MPQMLLWTRQTWITSYINKQMTSLAGKEYKFVTNAKQHTPIKYEPSFTLLAYNNYILAIHLLAHRLLKQFKRVISFIIKINQLTQSYFYT